MVSSPLTAANSYRRPLRIATLSRSQSMYWLPGVGDFVGDRLKIERAVNSFAKFIELLRAGSLVAKLAQFAATKMVRRQLADESQHPAIAAHRGHASGRALKHFNEADDVLVELQRADEQREIGRVFERLAADCGFTRRHYERVAKRPCDFEYRLVEPLARWAAGYLRTNLALDWSGERPSLIQTAPPAAARI